MKDTWIGFSARNIAKQAVTHCTSMISWMMGCLKWQIIACSLQVA